MRLRSGKEPALAPATLRELAAAGISTLREVAATSIESLVSIGVSDASPLHSNIVDNSKFLGWRREETLGSFGPLCVLDKFIRQSLAGDETRKLSRRDLLNPAQIRQLITELVVGAIEPETPAPAFPRAAMHSQWCPDGIPEFALA